MEADVKSAIYSGSAEDDRSLALLLGLTIDEVLDGRSLFPNPLEEPVFYKHYFKPWVEDAIEKLRQSQKKEQQ